MTWLTTDGYYAETGNNCRSVPGRNKSFGRRVGPDQSDFVAPAAIAAAERSRFRFVNICRTPLLSD
jgi:hypothetical protein